MSYTLRGRVESRLAAAVLPFLAACVLAAALGEWWPLELAGAMVAVGLALDVAVYDRLLPYQPAWAALPLGAAELAATMLLVRRLGVEAPLEPALCGDYSHCEIRDNDVAGIAPDRGSDDAWRQGYAIQAHFHAVAELEGNTVSGSPGGVAAVAGATIEHE